MNVDLFVRQIETMYGRLNALYEGAAASSLQGSQLMPAVFKELGTASEKLQLAATQLLCQNQELAIALRAVEAERQRYLELFEFVPDACIVTDAEGTIREANRAAAALFNVPQNYLAGKSIALFTLEENRQNFYKELNSLTEFDRPTEWEMRLQPRNNPAFDAALTCAAIRNWAGELTGIRWCARDITERKRAQRAIESSSCDPSANRDLHCYEKGETIPLIPQTIWLVCRGTVKLSTLCNTGEETIVGFAGPLTPFGTSLTSLQIYQATALSDVQLACISQTEIGMSPYLMEAILPKINQRLRQAELLLTVTGERRVKDRLHRLLMFLKTEIGEAVPEGTRLSVRLTHEELAAACCTTRVTVTREINKLQQQGKIAIDCDRHLILKHGDF
ncbi:MAG: PAS domain S-box protein [Oscillatoriaceae cyanobacterium Prado104]|nr:PAS domain S-box protein [Oscillatoriaceae cyanobacterium Prado104]